MPWFTLPLKDVIRITGGTTEIAEDGITRLTNGKIGLEYYDLFEPNYRPILTGKIIDHYWNREIGHETIDQFQLNMRRKMNEIMPYYNKFYYSLQIEFDPLKTIDLSTITSGTETQNSTSNGTSSQETDNAGQSRTVSSETPQTMLSGNGDYATAAADANSTSKATGTGTQESSADTTGKNDSTSTVSGYQGLAADLLVRYRDSIVNVDLMVIAELEELFMQVWDTGDSYTRGFLL